MELYFKNSAKCWLEGFPLGNGRIGAVIHGTPDHEVLQLNEDTLWSGSPYSGQTGLSPEVVKQAGELAMAGKYEEAQKVIEEKLEESEDVQVYLPFGDLHLDFVDEHGTSLRSDITITDYERHLDLERAVASARYVRNGAEFTRSCFISAPAQGLVYQIKSSQPFSLLVHCDGTFIREKIYEENRFTLTGICPGRSGFKVIKENKPEHFLFPEEPELQGVHFVGKGFVTTEGGTVTGTSEGILLEHVTAVEIRMAIRTSFRGFDKAYPEQYSDAEIRDMLAADLEKLSRPFEKLQREHVEEYRSFYGRTSLRLWDDDKQTRVNDNREDTIEQNNDSPKTSDGHFQNENAVKEQWFDKTRLERLGTRVNHCDLRERLAAFQAGASDPELYAILFAFGKYLLISSSRPGTQAANLQGIWSNDIIPPWFGDFTVNINTEMNYWMTGPLNLAQMQEPLVNLCKALVKNGQKTARELFNCEGTACFHNTDIWGKTSPATGKAVWSFWPFGEAWLCRNLFDQYLFTEDKEYLKEIMPILEENVRFCLAQLQETDQGLAICPATSPENLFYEDCSVAKYSENTLAIVRNLFRDYVKGCEVLGLQNQIVCDVLEALERMVPTAVGSKGQILEWNQEFPEQDVHHRHVSHLYELHPGCGITPQTPELYKAVRKSLELRGDEGTGWSLAWKVLMWARMEDGAHVEKIMRNLFYVVDPTEEMGIRRGGIYPNLFCAHPPFQIDGNLGYSAAVAEILVQSQGEELVLLPALPPSWRNGEATGFIARGNIRVDLKWEGKNVTYTLTPAHDTTLRLRVGKGGVRGYSLRGGVAYEGNGGLS